MDKFKILYISQEILPFLPETEMSHIGRFLPQGIQENGNEVRVFMPRFGTINERRNQLHEVIRLSGMNIIIDDTDHSLIIKVASIQSARMQVYFIDNDEYFKRRFTTHDEENEFFGDNDERMIFFGRGSIETVKKLRWTPDIVHCHGWMSALVPLFLKKAYKDDPLFANAKIVYSLYNDEFEEGFNNDIAEKISTIGVPLNEMKKNKPLDYVSLSKLAIDNSDAVVQGNPEVNNSLVEYTKSKNKQFLTYKNQEEYIEAYENLYQELLA